MKNSLSIVIPAYNEMTRLLSTLRKVGAYLSGSRFDAAEVIIVDDGSDDGTSEAALQEETVHRAWAMLSVIQNLVNMGKGFSVRCGMAEAIYENVICMDADASTPIEELDHLLGVFSEGKRRCGDWVASLEPFPHLRAPTVLA